MKRRHRLIKQKLNTTQGLIVILTMLLAVSLVLAGCNDSTDDEIDIDDSTGMVSDDSGSDYAPVIDDYWEVSTPEAQGLDPELIDQLYSNAESVETITSLLIIKDGYLVAEKYFNEGSIDKKNLTQSVTKSLVSACMGIAIDQGYVSSVDQKMMDYFPELSDQITDTRKNEITVQQMLQMRAGYPWEESSTELFESMYSGWRASTLVDFPLIRDPGSGHDYSNLTSHLLGIIIARSAETDLKAFADENLFIPLGMEPDEEWIYDWEYNYIGHGGTHFTSRDMAKFGLLYLNDGEYNGEQIVPAEWVEDSFIAYTEDAFDYRVGKNFKDIGYGYQWWSARAGEHHYDLAWGHGGQQIVVFEEYDMVVVVTADPLFGDHGSKPWKLERENVKLVADFISTLP